MDRASVGPYRIVDRLGAGGMGEVLLAFDTRLGRRVALKSLSDPSLDAPRARERLLREARAAAHITHPNIAAIYDILETGEHPCIVMEYAQGEPLSAVVSRGPMPCRDVLRVARQLVDAVAHAHAAGVIHRDLKPANIVLTPEGTVKVLDFGLARTYESEEAADPGTDATRDVTRSAIAANAGTPAYMAPEQLVGRPANALTDIYSLGATLYELLAGRRAFDAPDRAALAWDIVSKPVPPLASVVPSVPAALAAVVEKAMAREPADRYQSASDMAADLRLAEEDGQPGSQASVERVATGPGYDDAASSRRMAPRVAVLAAVLAVAALVVTIVVAVRSRGTPAPAPSSQFVAVVPFASAGGDPAAAAEAAGFREAVVATLEGLSSVNVLSRPAVQWLSSSGDARKDLLGSGVNTLVSGKVSGSLAAREFTVKVEKADGTVVSAKVYRGGAEGMSAIQADAVRDIVVSLGVALTPADADRLKRGPRCRPETYEDIAKGRALLEREDLGGHATLAETTLREAATADPSCALAYAGLADACWARYRVEHASELADLASEAIVKASTLDPDSPTIRMSLAQVYMNTGRLDAAEHAARFVISRRPTDDEPHRVLSGILDDQHRTEEAAAELEQAIALRPNNVINYLVRGIRDYNAARYEAALASFERVLTRQPDNEWATIDAIAAHAKLGNFQQAIDVYQASPVKNATMRSNLGSIYFALNRCAEAAEVMKEAVEMAPRDDIKRRNLGDAYACLGRPSEAVQQYRDAVGITREMLRVNKTDARVRARHALYEAKCGQKAAALDDIAEALRQSPSDNEVLYKAAALHSLLKQPTQAVERLREAIEAGYSRTLARVDWDLNPIKPLPDVQRILGAAGK